MKDRSGLRNLIRQGYTIARLGDTPEQNADLNRRLGGQVAEMQAVEDEANRKPPVETVLIRGPRGEITTTNKGGPTHLQAERGAGSYRMAGWPEIEAHQLAVEAGKSVPVAPPRLLVIRPDGALALVVADSADAHAAIHGADGFDLPRRDEIH
jgi:hypothetical protein